MSQHLATTRTTPVFTLAAEDVPVIASYWHRLIARLDLYAPKLSPETLKSYGFDFRDFVEFCEGRGETAVPASPDVVVDFAKARLNDQQKRATVRRKLAGIGFVHKMAGASDPTQSPELRVLLKPNYLSPEGQTREAPAQQVPIRLEALECEEVVLLEDLLLHAPDTLVGQRAKLVVSIGFDTGLRGSELSSILIPDLQLGTGGGSVRVHHIKGRPGGDPIYRSLSAVSVDLVRHWIDETGLDSGPLFRSMTKYGTFRDSALRRRALTTIIKDLAARVPKRPVSRAEYEAGLFEQKYLHQIARVSTHSFRIGHAQELFINGAGEAGIMKALDWKNAQTLQAYLRHLDVRQSSSAQLLRDKRGSVPLTKL